MILFSLYWLIQMLLKVSVPVLASIFQGPSFWALSTLAGLFVTLGKPTSVQAFARTHLTSLSPVSSSVGQQQIVVREAKVSFKKYQNILQSSPFLEPPHNLILRRLKEDQLSSVLQQKIDTSLELLARGPSQARLILEKLYDEFTKEPRTRAIKQAMQLILERMRLHAESHDLKDWKASIEKRLSYIDQPKSLGSWKKNLINEEIHSRLNVIKQEKGLEDLEVFVNGEPLTLAHEISMDFEGQWLFVSSSYRPKLIEGAWPKASEALAENWSPWLLGTCSKPIHQDPILALSGKVIGVYFPDCEVVLQDSFQIGLKQFSFHRISEDKAWYQNPYWVSALAFGIGLLVLRSQNQQLRISF